MIIQVTESVAVNMDTEQWVCERCDTELGPAAGNYKEGTLVAARDPRDVHGWLTPSASGQSLAPDPQWCRIVEFYCPNCATLLEAEYLPPGHPPTWDIELDIASLKRRFAELTSRLPGTDAEEAV